MSLSSVEAKLITVPAEYGPGFPYVLPYDRIAVLSTLGEEVGVLPTRGYTERRLDLPGDMAEKLLAAAKIAAEERKNPTIEGPLRINCHLAARLFAGMELSLDAPFTIKDGVEVATRLKLGEIGVLGSFDPDDEPWHSVVGMGEDSTECIQEIWGWGELGISELNAVLNYLQLFVPGRKVAMFRQAPTPPIQA